jgi:capsule polysaccharide export protein KpsE/RkpR
MTPLSIIEPVQEPEQIAVAKPANWVLHATLLWEHRRVLSRVTVVALLLSLAIAFAIPKRYDSVARIMPPDQQGSGAALLAALVSHSGSAGGMGGLGGLLGGLLSSHTSSALFEDLLQSGTVTGHLIDRFHLQQIYHTRYRIDAAKRLARRTSITDNKRSGVISIRVEDADPVRARDLTQDYLDELNRLLTQTSISSAHQERIFIERRLQAVSAELEQAQLKFSEFSSRNSTVDIKEQTRAMVDAAARVQAQVLVEQAGLGSLRQIYGDDNVRVRASEARIASLQRELGRLSGSSAPLAIDVATGTRDDAERGKDNLYPALRQLPRLAVPFADLYRRVQVQEAVFELLTQQYELARIEEAKDVPVVSVIDAPGIPEKKAYPSRLLLVFLLTGFSFVGASALILMRERWETVNACDPRKLLVEDVLSSLRKRTQQWRNRRVL